MRVPLLLSLTTSLLFACGGSDDGGGGGGADAGGGGADGGNEQPANSFRITSTPLELTPGEEVTYCYYDTVPVDRDVGIKRWSSTMTPGSHHLIVFALGESSHPDGELTTDCDLGGQASGFGVWTYSAGLPEYASEMPEGVGIQLKAGQKVAIQMHYFNASTEPLTANVEVTGEYYADGVAYTPASAFITFAGDIDVPAGVGSEGAVTHTCDVPAGSKFFTMSTHAHRRATYTRVRDLGDDEMVFESDDWEHPGVMEWKTEPFFEFDGKLEYHCAYVNDREQPTTTGDSAPDDEMCMAVGYFFPADGPVLCYNDFTVPL